LAIPKNSPTIFSQCGTPASIAPLLFSVDSN
jgi:hypothetical protein